MLWALLFPAPLLAGSAAEAWAQIEHRRLWHDPVWQALLHHEGAFLGSDRSRIVTPGFFLAPDGAKDPRAELKATVRAFYGQGAGAVGDEAVGCRYPARHRWLRGELAKAGIELPMFDCPLYRSWLEQIQPAGVSLVFPDAYVNSPASMFGHTLLRVESARFEVGEHMLAYAVNFSALTDEDNGIVFAVRGMTGGYPAGYGVFYYHHKLREYSYIENRDLWSYPLSLSASQQSMLLAHLWELRDARFDYYFFKHNCSYQLLALLEVVAPEARLTERFALWATPVDTIRALRRAGLIDGPASYRPSAYRRLNHALNSFDARQRRWTVALADGRMEPQAPELSSLAPARRAAVLDAAYGIMKYRHNIGELSRDAGLSQALGLLRARSRLPASTRPESVPVPPVSPDRGHRTRRMGLGMAWDDGVGGAVLDLRAAYHDRLDPPAGYPSGARIEMLSAELGYWGEGGGAAIHKLALLDILSAEPRNDWSHPGSWKLSFGMRRLPSRAAYAPESALGGYLEGGQGLTYGWGDSGRLYGFAVGSADIRPELDPDYRLGAGLLAGFEISAGRLGGSRLEVEANQPLAGADDRYTTARLVHQWHLSRNLGLRLSAQRLWTDDGPRSRLGLVLMSYH